MPVNTNKQRLNMQADEPISVTVDASDLGFASLEPLRNIIIRYGRPVSARAFADFQQSGTGDLAVQLYQMGFTLVHCPTWPNGDGVPKPVVSDVMAQDMRDQLEDLDEVVETYILVATSRDYIAVANALRRHDRRVVVVAEEAKVSRELRLCADEFAILPPTRPERSSESTRAARFAEASRSERSAESARVERQVEAARAERQAEPARVEKQPEPARVEKQPEPARVEKQPEPARVEKQPEPARAERSEPLDSVRLPTDAEVLAEVRRIVAAEGICTPRRLARALCPVDRTATGELRSRIANRIQTLVDSGKLQRERLVVGGTSVETILAREEKNGRTAHVTPQEPASAPLPSSSAPVPSREPEPAEPVESAASDGMIQGEPVSEVLPDFQPEPFFGPVAEASAADESKGVDLVISTDLDALVESVLRSPELAAGLLNRDGGGETAAPVELVSPADPTPPAQEPPKRTRSRRKAPSSKTSSPREAVPEPNGTA